MKEEMKMILKMIEDGVITADEAEKLLGAMPSESENSQKNNMIVSEATTFTEPKKISIRVLEGDRVKVNMSIPISLLKMGLKLGVAAGAVGFSRAKNEDEAALLDVLRSIDVDEIMSVIAVSEAALPFKVIDITDENGRLVQVFVE
jgi:hypothetical protein